MRQRAKQLQIGLGCAMLLILGCGASGSEGAAAPGGPAPSRQSGKQSGELTGLVAAAEVFQGDFDGMAERRVIRFLTTFNRTNYFLDGGEPKGAVAEGVRLFDEYVNKKLGTGKLKVHVAIIPVQRDQLLPALAAGKGDIAAGNITVTDSRREMVDFSDPFLTGIREVVVTGAKAPQISTLEDLAGQEVWVRPSSSFHESLTALSERLKSEGHGAIDIRAADELLETEDLMQMVAGEIIGITIADSHMADFWGDILGDKVTVHSDLAISEDSSIAWAFRHDSPKLAEVVNEFVRGHKKGTMLGNVVMKRYLKDNKWVRNPLSHSDRLEKHRPSFERWAGEYKMNWVLIAAQGYQESQLDQSVKSSAGAVGVMQIKPSTAADPNVGIHDISTADPNIQAGIKYLRFIRDRYFSEGGMTELNQGLFALASYNAGPARIAGIRKQAAEKGLDPNVWFRNVEQLAPRETVGYVANVFKYYISYQEYLRQQALKEQ